jgi:tyrosine-protein phosphatase YwqE
MLAMKLIKNKMVNFIGSDCHNLAQFEIMLDTLKTKGYQEAVDLDLINNTLFK